MVNLQQPSHREGSRLLLVDSSVLPEVFLRVVEAKRMLAVGQVRSLSEAAKAAGISRSALYKYKDCVFVHNEALDDKVITLSARLERPARRTFRAAEQPFGAAGEHSDREPEHPGGWGGGGFGFGAAAPADGY